MTPSTKTQDFLDKVSELRRKGKTISEACAQLGHPVGAYYRWNRKQRVTRRRPVQAKRQTVIDLATSAVGSPSRLMLLVGSPTEIASIVRTLS